jgi:hypothetical protein
MIKRSAVLKEDITIESAPVSPVRLVEFETIEPEARNEFPGLYSKEEFCRDRATD